MTRTLMLAALLAAPAAARADVIIRVPFVYVEVGPAVVVRAPFVTVVVPRTPRIPAPPMPPILPPARPVPPVDDGVPPVPDVDRIETRTPPPVAGTRTSLTKPPADRAGREEPRGVTPAAFVNRAKAFEAGKYEVVFEHPYTGKPVKVEFELPVRPRRVNASRDRVEFRWGLLRGLNIEFLRDGGVRVS